MEGADGCRSLERRWQKQRELEDQNQSDQDSESVANGLEGYLSSRVRGYDDHAVQERRLREKTRRRAPPWSSEPKTAWTMKSGSMIGVCAPVSSAICDRHRGNRELPVTKRSANHATRTPPCATVVFHCFARCLLLVGSCSSCCRCSTLPSFLPSFLRPP